MLELADKHRSGRCAHYRACGFDSHLWHQMDGTEDNPKTGGDYTVDKATETILEYELKGEERLEEVSLALASQTPSLIVKMAALYPDYYQFSYTNSTREGKTYLNFAKGNENNPDILIYELTIPKSQDVKDIKYLLIERMKDQVKVTFFLQIGDCREKFEFVSSEGKLTFKHFGPIGGGINENQFAEEMEKTLKSLEAMPNIIEIDPEGVDLVDSEAPRIKPHDLPSRVRLRRAKRN